jgi:pimeloyl-ACP methyl ester carboxylesterase
VGIVFAFLKMEVCRIKFKVMIKMIGLLAWGITAFFCFAGLSQQDDVRYFFKSEQTENPSQVKLVTLPSGVQLEYSEQGSPGGIPVIMLHGISDSRRSFDMVLPNLSSTYHVFSISQRGHGNSSKPESGYDPEDFASDIAAFMKHIGLQPAIVVGHSMGSTNAQCFAALYPELTRGLVLIGSFANFKKPIVGELKSAIDQMRDPVDSTFIAEFQVSTLVKPIHEDTLRMFINESRKLPASVWKNVAAGWDHADYTQQLRSFSKPVLLFWGNKDSFCPRADQELLVKAFRNARLIEYDGIGHALHWEEPIRFSKDLDGFLKEFNKP